MPTSELAIGTLEFKYSPATNIMESAPASSALFENIAVCHKNYQAKWIETKSDKKDELASGLLIRVTDKEYIENTDAGERGELEGLLLAFGESINIHPEAIEDNESLNWTALAEYILDDSTSISELDDTNGKLNNTLLAAFTCSVLAESDQNRLDFLKKVSNLGQRRKMAEALRQSNLTIIINPKREDRLIKRIVNDYVAFSCSDVETNFFIEFMENKDTQVTLGKPKLLQKHICKSYESGVIDQAAIDQSRYESLVEPDDQDPTLDPFKIERFALEQMFIRDQFTEAFNVSNINDSNFIKTLKDKREISLTNPFVALRNDMVETLLKVTLPIKQKYMVDIKNGNNYQPLTTQQHASVRFREVVRMAVNFQNMAKYIKQGQHLKNPSPDLKIWDFAEQGAVLPAHTHRYLSTLVHKARVYEIITGDNVSEQELWRLAQSNRRCLSSLAMICIDDFNLLDKRGDFTPPTMESIQNATPISELEMKRDSSGQLILNTSFSSDKSCKSKTYRGKRLGCPAGRIGIEDPDQQANIDLYSTNNFIDFILNAAINEAYHRKIFDLARYKITY